MRMQQVMGGVAAAGAVFGSVQLAEAAVDSTEAFNNATVQPAGPRSGSSGKAFFNVEGSGNGSFSSFGVADFAGTDYDFGFTGPVGDVASLSVSLTQSNISATNSGPISFYLASDTATSIEPGSGLVYNSAFAEEGVGSQLGSLFFLGNDTFNEASNGTVNTYTFNSLDSSTEAFLINALNSDATLRLVVAATGGTTVATWAGYTNFTLAGPTLTIDASEAPVPEPASLALLAAGGLLIARRRSR